MLAILDALLTVEVKSGRTKVAQRVSYKALDVEQIGHCYEGLLDHGCAPVDVLALGLVGPDGAEPEITIADLERHLSAGTEALCEWLADKTRCNKTASALAQLLGHASPTASTSPASVSPAATTTTPSPGSSRSGASSAPTCAACRSCCCPARSSSPRRRPAATWARSTRPRRSPRRSCSTPSNRSSTSPGPRTRPTRRSGSCGPRARSSTCASATPPSAPGPSSPPPAATSPTDSSSPSSSTAPATGRSPAVSPTSPRRPPEEQVVLARREVVDHCLYGVDKNPVAAEMAKLSLWLTTMARERPFTFLDHAIQVGDSLLGITDMEQLRWLHLDPAERKGAASFETLALDLRLEGGHRPRPPAPGLVRRHGPRRHREATTPRRAPSQARRSFSRGRRCRRRGPEHCWQARQLRRSSASIRQIDRIRAVLDDGWPLIERSAAIGVLHGISTGWLRTDLPDQNPSPWDRQCLHWPLAFPEVFLDERKPGFDAVIGNPPFLGGVNLAETFGSAYERFLKVMFPESTGFVDLAVYFHRRVSHVVAPSGRFGLFGPQNLVSTANRASCTDALLAREWEIEWARRPFIWPGTANLHVCIISYAPKGQALRHLLDGLVVPSISSSLDATFDASSAHQLKRTWIEYSQGTDLYGASFVRRTSDWRRLLEAEPALAKYLRPYVNAQSLCTSTTFRTDLLAVDFGDRGREALRDVELALADVAKAVSVERANQTKQIHEHRPWLHWDKRLAAYTAARSRDEVLVCPNVSKHLPMAFVDSSFLLSKGVKFFPGAEDWAFGILQSSAFWEWAFVTSGRRGDGRLNFSSPRLDRHLSFAGEPDRRRPTASTVATAASQGRDARQKLGPDGTPQLTRRSCVRRF